MHGRHDLVPIEDASRFGIIVVNEAERVTGFEEKPQHATPIPGSQDLALASMGVYIFDTNLLVHALEADATEPTTHDFGKDIIPSLINRVPVYSYRFYDENKKASKYWRDIGTLDAYFEANMDLLKPVPPIDLYQGDWSIRTYEGQHPPARSVPGRSSLRFLSSTVT